MHYLRKHLPPSGKILDAGGGPGRYSLELCRAGYKVVLLDISPELIATAKERFQSEPEAIQDRLLEFAVGDIVDLSCFETAHFDIVLCLGGPLTHISDEVDRLEAISELVRVAKPGAVVCVSVMGLLAVLRTILVRFSNELVGPSFQTLVKQGDTLGTTGTVWHFFRADELRKLAESCGLTTIEMAGCEGLSTGLAKATNLLGQDEVKWRRWVNLVLETSAEPAVVDMAEHILYIGRAPKIL
ncbi:MAG: class I SAM-dependent methyltransferase [Chloroflexota bacterium]|nr:class I SAM-dependent methyltransferase [Chloroflexota bacterium]